MAYDAIKQTVLEELRAEYEGYLTACGSSEAEGIRRCICAIDRRIMPEEKPDIEKRLDLSGVSTLDGLRLSGRTRNAVARSLMKKGARRGPDGYPISELVCLTYSEMSSINSLGPIGIHEIVCRVHDAGCRFHDKELEKIDRREALRA